MKKRKAKRSSFMFAPRKRGESLPEGEARGGDFALSEIPHSYDTDYFLRAKLWFFSITSKYRMKNLMSFTGYLANVL